VLFAQGRDLTGQKQGESNTAFLRAGNEVVVPNVRHSVYDCALHVHVFKLPFLPCGINRIVTQNATAQRETCIERLILPDVSCSLCTIEKNLLVVKGD
jgi:hypothetical protein